MAVGCRGEQASRAAGSGTHVDGVGWGEGSTGGSWQWQDKWSKCSMPWLWTASWCARWVPPQQGFCCGVTHLVPACRRWAAAESGQGPMEASCAGPNGASAAAAGRAPSHRPPGVLPTQYATSMQPAPTMVSHARAHMERHGYTGSRLRVKQSCQEVANSRHVEEGKVALLGDQVCDLRPLLLGGVDPGGVVRAA